MTVTRQETDAARAVRGLEDDRSSVRLRAALAVGTTPDPRFVDKLVERCAIEPEFFVRDMLTWALTRHPASMTLPGLLREVRSERAQARSQALHTLSKIGDRQAWPAITRGCCPTPTTRWRGAPGGPRSYLCRKARSPRWPRRWRRSSGAVGGRRS
ncbi:HEAT repeat domain-containing protein [Streptomyces hirsutus]